MLIEPFFECPGSHSHVEGFWVFNFSLVDYVFDTAVAVQGAFCGALTVTCFLVFYLVQGSGYFFIMHRHDGVNVWAAAI